MPDWALCDGGGDADGDHCCYIHGQPCPHLQVDGPSGRRYACGLMVELGSWSAVHADARYLADVKPAWTAAGVVDCGPWIGANRETYVEILARGSITAEEFNAVKQCCFARRYSTSQQVNQAVRAINRTIG